MNHYGENITGTNKVGRLDKFDDFFLYSGEFPG